MNQTVNLNLITQIFPDVEYHPDQFPGLVLGSDLKTATLIFNTGSHGLHRRQVRKDGNSGGQERCFEKKGGIPLEHEPQIEIQNIVASASLGGKIHLEAFSSGWEYVRT